MLYLNPPFHIIRGVSVFADHADPLQFYFLPAMPHLTTVHDELEGVDIPQLQLLKFTGDAGSGGFLNFSVNLGVDEEILDSVRLEVKSLFQLDELPRLAPALLEDGYVRLMVLGKETEEPEPGQPPQPTSPSKPNDLPEFVLKIDHYAKPALYGDNQAVFSVQLDQYGAALIEASLKGEMMPVGIVYALEFLALRPAFNVRITADWDRVQTHFQERSERRVFFFSSEVDEIVDKLIEDKVIKIEVDNFIPEGEDAANIMTNPAQVVNEVKDMILDTFFEPSLNPISAEKDGWDKFNDTTNRLLTLAVTGGWSSVATVSYKKVDMTRVDRKRFDFNMSERTAVRRSIYPQAHLQGLTRVLRDADGAINLEDFVRTISLDDPFFERREVRAINRANMEEDTIESINVFLRYGSDTKTVVLDQATPEDTKDWTSILENEQMVRGVTTSYRVNFKGVDSAERPMVLESPEVVTEAEVLEVNPRGDDLYHIINVPITTLDFPWESYPHVQVDLRYEDPENEISLNDTFVLNEQQNSIRWPLFLRDREKDSFQYRLTYRAADNRDWSTDWTPTNQQQLLLRDPRPSKRTITVIPAVSWSFVSTIFVDLTYQDEGNGVSAEKSLMFNSFTDADKAPKTFSVALADSEKRLVNYTVKLLLRDNSLIEQPPSMTMSNQIFVRADMKGHRVVTVQPEDVDFGAENVREVRIQLRYEDEDNGLSFANSFTFKSSGEKGFFEYDYVDPQKRSYTVDATTIFNNGFIANKPAKTADRDILTIEL